MENFLYSKQCYAPSNAIFFCLNLYALAVKEKFDVLFKNFQFDLKTTLNCNISRSPSQKKLENNQQSKRIAEPKHQSNAIGINR